MAIEAMITAKAGTAEKDVVVTNDNDVAFELTIDNAGEGLPVGLRITGITVVPHDGATPKGAVSTQWRLRLYSRYAKGIEDLRSEDTRYDDPASDEIGLDKTEWNYENDDGVGSIYGTIGIKNGATDCSFTIAIDFERRR